MTDRTEGTDDTVVGVDGYRGGWIAALVHGRVVRWQPFATFGALLDSVPRATVALDMPIGVTAGARPADLAARAWLTAHGAPWQSIFLTPTAAVVDAYAQGRSHAEAMAARGAAAGTSIQAWNLIAKMIEVRDALPGDAADRVSEAHPECSFRLLDPAIGAASKKTGRGVGLRLRALRREFELPDLADAPAGVGVDDLLDAVAVAWTARRIAAGAPDLIVLGDADASIRI